MMKQTQVALALALAALAGTAAAQSNVTIYGVVDTSLGKMYDSDASTNMMSSYSGTTQLGFRGSEDLGNGLKANFQLEASGMESDTGAWTGGFKRQSWIGLSGKFGEVMAGRTTLPQNRIMGTFDLNGTIKSSAMGAIGLAANSSFFNSRADNQIQYATPNMGGFQARVAYAFHETTSGSADRKKALMQLAARYSNAGLTLGAAVQPKSTHGKEAAATNYRTAYSVGAKYNFGVAEASVLYTRNELRSQGDGVGIGIAAPIGAWKVGAQFARVTSAKNADGTKHVKEGSNAYELFANYTLSKRTSFYSAYGSVNTKAEKAFAYKQGDTFAIGVTHKF